MTAFISESEYQTLCDQYRSGDVNVFMPRQVARQFFLKVQPAEVKSTTGQSIVGKKVLIWLINISSPLLFIFSLMLIGTGYGPWEASLLVPIAGICWTVIYGLTSDKGGWLVGTIPLVLSALPIIETGNPLEPIFLFVLSIWLQRASYLLADYWLMDIVMNHFGAYEMMEEHIQIETA